MSFNNLSQKDEKTYWAHSSSTMSFTAPLPDVQIDDPEPPLPEDRTDADRQCSLAEAIQKEGSKSIVKGKVVQVINLLQLY